MFITFNNSIVLNQKVHIPKIEILVIYIKTKAFSGNSKYVSIPFMVQLFLDEYANVNYVTDDLHTTYKSEEMID